MSFLPVSLDTLKAAQSGEGRELLKNASVSNEVGKGKGIPAWLITYQHTTGDNLSLSSSNNNTEEEELKQAQASNNNSNTEDKPLPNWLVTFCNTVGFD